MTVPFGLRRILLPLALWLAPAPGHALTEDVPAEQKAAFTEAVSLRARGEHQSALAAFSRLAAAAPGSFTVNYEYGRLLAQMKKYREAGDAFDAAIKLKDRVDSDELTLHNTRGFVLLMLNQHERALDEFRTELGSANFGKLPPASRMKVHNNAGLAYLQLDRYAEAQQQFETARALGSSLASKNLAIIGSILETLKASSEEVPGIFAPAVGSARTLAEVDGRANDVAKQLEVPVGALRLYRQANGIYQFTHGANFSYRKAERLTKAARDKGVKDAFVASTAEWSDETSILAKKQPHARQ